MESQTQNSPGNKTIQTPSICSILDIQSYSDEDFQDMYQAQAVRKKSSSKKKTAKKSYEEVQVRKWTEQDEKLLIVLHRKMGNKWTQLTQYYPGTSQNFIKNHFYSRLRKSVRKLNKLVVLFFGKKYSKFKLNIIFKLSNISEGKIAEKDKISSQIFKFYRDFLYNLIEFSQKSRFQEKGLRLTPQQFIYLKSFILGLIALENLFRLIRGERSAKGKKKNIAYLRQFKFRLDQSKSIEMVITKESIYLEDSSKVNNSLGCFQNSENDKGYDEQIQSCQLIDQEKLNFHESEVNTPQNIMHSVQNKMKIKKDSFMTISSEFNIIQQDNIIPFQMIGSLQNSISQEIEKRSELWKDYYGQQLKQYDICNNVGSRNSSLDYEDFDEQKDYYLHI